VTVCVAVRLPGEGCVLGADGRVTSGGAVVATAAVKVRRFGALYVGVAGDAPTVLSAWRRTGPSTVEELLTCAPKGRDWEAVAYDCATDRLVTVDSTGAVMTYREWAAVGTGGTAALACMDYAARELRDATPELVAHCVRRIVRSVSKYDTACGGRVRVVYAKSTA